MAVSDLIKKQSSNEMRTAEDAGKKKLLIRRLSCQLSLTRGEAS